jgi:hypothetical protein
MKEKDTKNNSSDSSSQPKMKATSPIVIKIEAPKEAMKKKIQQQIKIEEKKVADEEKISDRSKCCQLLPILLFLVTFATVLTALIIYMDPSSEYND